MPAKGQTCANCNGNCCYGFVIEMYDEELKVMGDDALEISAREHLRRGSIFHPHRLKDSVCVNKTIDGCRVYSSRPKFCRTYYCNGKLWQPKNTPVIAKTEVKSG